MGLDFSVLVPLGVAIVGVIGWMFRHGYTIKSHGTAIAEQHDKAKKLFAKTDSHHDDIIRLKMQVEALEKKQEAE